MSRDSFIPLFFVVMVVFFLFLALAEPKPASKVRDNQAPDSLDLSTFRWKNRLILLFGPKLGDPQYRQQVEALSQDAPGLEERDILVFHFLNQGGAFYQSKEISPNSTQKLQKKYKIDPSTFTCILIGKDGGVKLRKEEVVQLNSLYALIDSMPMRQSEMRNKHKH